MFLSIFEQSKLRATIKNNKTTKKYQSTLCAQATFVAEGERGVKVVGEGGGLTEDCGRHTYKPQPQKFAARYEHKRKGTHTHTHTLKHTHTYSHTHTFRVARTQNSTVFIDSFMLPKEVQRLNLIWRMWLLSFTSNEYEKQKQRERAQRKTN